MMASWNCACGSSLRGFVADERAAEAREEFWADHRREGCGPVDEGTCESARRRLELEDEGWPEEDDEDRS